MLVGRKIAGRPLARPQQDWEANKLSQTLAASTQYTGQVSHSQVQSSSLQKGYINDVVHPLSDAIPDHLTWFDNDSGRKTRNHCNNGGQFCYGAAMSHILGKFLAMMSSETPFPRHHHRSKPAWFTMNPHNLQNPQRSTPFERYAV
jgi:hypothetical protein